PGSGGGGTKTFYLGAIADYDNVVGEINENNNAAIQTGVGGSPEGTAVSVVTESTIAQKGGGSFGIYDLLVLVIASLILVLRIFRRPMITVLIPYTTT
ncbi:MAG: hypothetical protein ACE5EH_12280, partial [Gammaproteobacteria bacterium]